MGETDRQTDTTVKTTRWAFTAYEAQFNLFRAGHMPNTLAEWGWNHEKCPQTNRIHYQGYLRTKQQVRLSQLKKQFPGVHLEPARNWEATKNYSGKEETRVPGTQPVSEHSQIPDIYAYTEIVASRLPDRGVIEKMRNEAEDEIRRRTPRGVPPDLERGHCATDQQYMEFLVDVQVRLDIEKGYLWAGHIAVNPQWISLWRKYGFEYIIGAKKNRID